MYSSIVLDEAPDVQGLALFVNWAKRKKERLKITNHSVQRKLFGGFKSNQTQVILTIAVFSHSFSV